MAFISSGVANAKYNNEFFITENQGTIVGQVAMDRIICSTDQNMANLNYIKAEYKISQSMLEDINEKLVLFNNDIMEIYGNSYVYEHLNLNEDYCYSGTQDDQLQKVMIEGSTFSANCYSATPGLRRVNGVDVICASAPILKKVVFMAKPIGEIEVSIAEYCPGVMVDGFVDETAAVACLEGLDYSQITGNIDE